MAEKEITLLTRFAAQYRRKLLMGRIAAAWCAGLLGLSGLLAVLQPAFALFPWTVLPLVFDIAVAGALFFLVGAVVFNSIIRTPDLPVVARMIESGAGIKNPLLSIALELAADPLNARNPFAAQAYKRAVTGLAECPSAPALPGHLVSVAILTAAIAVWCIVNPLFSPRLLDFWKLPFASLSPAGVTVEPGTVAVPRNATVTLRLLPRTTRYPSCRLAISSADGERLSGALLRPDSGGGFSYRCDSVKSTFFYRFNVNGAGLKTDTVMVVPPPRLYRLSVALTPPAYTHQAPRTLPEGQGNFEAYAGSHARITIASDRLSRAWLVRGNDTLPLVTSGSTATGELPLFSPCDYTFALLDSLGQKSDSLQLFHIGCLEDEPPSVQIVKPGFNKELQPDEAETLFVEGVDDIGIRSLSLKWQVSGGQRRETATGERVLPIASGQKEIHTAFIWHLAGLSLYPGDTAFYWAEIVDTKPFGTPQKGVSDTFWFRVPGFEEIHRQLAKKQEYAEEKLRTVREREPDLQEKLERIAKSSNGRKELTWEQKQLLQDVKKEMSAQSDSLKKSIESLRENVEKMKQQGMIGEELARKMDQVRKAVDDLVKKYGDSLLFNMKDVEKPVSPQEMRQAIDKAAAMLPKLREQLDNVLKFLEMLKQDRKLAELAMRAERLAKDQNMVSQGTEMTPQETMEREKDLLEKIKELSKDVAENNRTDSSGKASESQKSLEQLDSLERSMQSSMSRSLSPGQKPMKQMSGSLLSLSQDLMQMMNFNMAARMERERQRLLALSHDALALADWQEEISREGDADEQSDPVAGVRSQQALKDALKKARATADSLSVTSPDDMLTINQGFNNAFQASEQVLKSMGAGGGQDGSAMSQSSSSLRMLGNSALTALSRMENGDAQSSSQCKGGQCMMPGLGRVSGRQSAINGMTADLLQKLFGEQGKPGGMGGNAQGLEQARQAAQRAQQGVADQLKELADKYGNEAGDGLKNKVNDLEDEARRIAAMLERPSPEITERQDRILAKMLETTLSMHKEGEGKDEWKSRTAEQTFSDGEVQAPGTFYKDIDTFHRLRQKAFLGDFPEGYRGALRAYFDELSEKYLK